MANEQARRLRRSMTPQEVRLWVHLRQWRELGFHFRRQRPESGYIVDFICLKHHLVIELDGSQHGMPEGAARDRLRDRQLGKDGFRVLRFWNHEIDQSFTGVLDTVLVALGYFGTPPTDLRSVLPPRSGEG